jgi:putative RecB family exonuclease
VQLLYLAEPLAIVAMPSDQKMAFLDKKVGAIWTAVEKACANESFRPNRGPLCDYCGFKAYCPAFGGDPSLVGATRVPEPVLL